MPEKIDRIVGGAQSVCVLSLVDALRSVLEEVEPKRRPVLLEAAKEGLQSGLALRANLEKKQVQDHLRRLLHALNGLAPAEPDIDVDALLKTAIEDVDLGSLTSLNGVTTYLEHQGDQIATNYARSGQAFWFQRVDYTEENQSFLAIGTSSGKHPRFPGQDFNVFCTTQGYRTIKDAGEDLVVYAGGRQLTRSADKNERACFIRFVPLDTLRTWRFWASTNKNGERRDVDGLKFTIKLNPDNPNGYDVTRINRPN
jgi:hypothetical protein